MTASMRDLKIGLIYVKILFLMTAILVAFEVFVLIIETILHAKVSISESKD